MGIKEKIENLGNKKLAIIIIGILAIIIIATIAINQVSSEPIKIESMNQQLHSLDVDNGPDVNYTYIYTLDGIIKNLDDNSNIGVSYDLGVVNGHTIVGQYYDSNGKLISTIKNPILTKEENGVEFSFTYGNKKLINMSKIVINILDENGNSVYNTTYNFNMGLFANGTPQEINNDQSVEENSSVQEERVAYEDYQMFLLTYKNIHTPQEIRDAWIAYDINENDKLEASEYNAMLLDNAI